MNSRFKYLTIFVSIILAFISISAMAAAMEGPTGGVFGQKEVLGFSADFWIFWVMVPLFLLPVVIAVGLESKLVGTVLTAYVLGGMTTDFFWFIINPHYGLERWNSNAATWLEWTSLGSFEIPSFYTLRIVLAIVLWFIFFKNITKVNLLFKKYLPWAVPK